jgi:hypothetical protein
MAVLAAPHRPQVATTAIGAGGCSPDTLRALVKYLDGISDTGIADLEIVPGMPCVYELDSELKAVRKYYVEPAGALETLEPALAGATAC